MPTDIDKPITLFLFAHQDDEFGVFAQIEQELRAGRRVRCVYATDGAMTASPDIRDAESRAVLQKLGVPLKDIIFIGRKLCIRDGQLYRHVNKFAQWLDSFVSLQQKLDICFVPAWEGGHPDHDFLHAITVEVLASQNSVIKIWQYPLYHGRNCIGPFFRMFSPLPENGPVSRSPIIWRDRIRYVRFCLAYPSQWRSWVGLFPFACLHYLFGGVQQLQNVNRMRLYHPPHIQPLYYERRGFLDWLSLHSAFKKLIARNSGKSSSSSDDPDLLSG